MSCDDFSNDTPHRCTQIILFTTDSEVLSLVANHDPLYQAEVVGRERESNTSTSDYTYYSEVRGEEWEGRVETLRPQTADRDDTSDHSDHSDTELMQQNAEERPFTTARRCTPRQKDQRDNIEISDASSSSRTLTGRVVKLCLAESWGDPDFIGLTGLELLQADTVEPLRLGRDQLSADSPHRLPWDRGTGGWSKSHDKCGEYVPVSQCSDDITWSCDHHTHTGHAYQTIRHEDMEL